VTAPLDRVFPLDECDDTCPAVVRFMAGPVAPTPTGRLDMDADRDPGTVSDVEPPPWMTHRGRT
jgi:hypothetical protein